MQVNRQSSNQNQNQNYPYINNIISNISHLNLNKVIYKKIAPNKTYQSKLEPRTYNSNQGLIKKVVSKEMIDFVKEEKPKKLFNDYNFGETLIYNDVPVFIDSRADVYTGEILKDYVSLRFMSNANKKYDKETFVDDIIEHYGFDAFLLENSSSLLPYLYSHKDKYEIVKSTKEAVYIRVK